MNKFDRISLNIEGILSFSWTYVVTEDTDQDETYVHRENLKPLHSLQTMTVTEYELINLGTNSCNNIPSDAWLPVN